MLGYLRDQALIFFTIEGGGINVANQFFAILALFQREALPLLWFSFVLKAIPLGPTAIPLGASPLFPKNFYCLPLNIIGKQCFRNAGCTGFPKITFSQAAELYSGRDDPCLRTFMPKKCMLRRGWSTSVTHGYIRV